MNIVYLHSHDTGRWIEPYGYPHPTPNYTRLAEQGVLFEQAFTPSPTCCPSRACLLSGQMPRKNGMIGLVHRGSKLRDPSTHLAAVLQRNGYRTAVAGIHHVFRRDAEDFPYDENIAQPGCDDVAERDPAVAEEAAAFIKRDHDKPFFLACGFFSTHRTSGRTNQWFNGDASPMGAPDRTTVPATLLDSAATRADIADYNVSLDRLDDCIGTVLDALDDAGLREDALVICTTDHGVPFPEHKSRLTDAGAGVLMILRGPGFEGGRRVSSMVSQLDVMPTLLEMLSIEPGHELDGTSLRPLLDDDRPLRDELFGETNYHAAYEPVRSVRTGDHLYIRNFAGAKRVLPNCDPGPTRNAMIDNGWDATVMPSEMLFDLRTDPDALTNVIDQSGYADTAADLRGRVKRQMRASGDPLLTRGFVPPWPGMLTTPADATYPGDEMVPAESIHPA